MTKNITLAVEDEVLEQARILAAENKTTVNAMVREFLTCAVERRRALRAPFESSVKEQNPESAAVFQSNPSAHERMKGFYEEGQAKYDGSKWFDRERTYDRDYQRAESYFENRKALLKLIDESPADMGKQKWNREALYDR